MSKEDEKIKELAAKKAVEVLGKEAGALMGSIGELLNSFYKDGLSQPIQETSTFATNLLKLVNTPVSAGVSKLERYFDEVASKVEPENLIEPPRQLTGSCADGIKYEPEGSPIHKMFVELLSRASDKEKQDQAHPAFPRILKELSGDEALILEKAYKEFCINYALAQIHNEEELDENTLIIGKLIENTAFTTGSFTSEDGEVFPIKPICHEPEHWSKIMAFEGELRDKLHYPQKIALYLENLTRLGLLTSESKQQIILSASWARIETESNKARATIEIKFRRFKREITEFGKLFLKACLEEPPAGEEKQDKDKASS